jgi:DNA (cytosine-5)-methyltransferase 1
MDLGFKDAGFSPVWANDIDPAAVETYNKSLGHVAHAGDLAGFVDTLPSPGSIDLVIGGPPCQGFSVAGKMDPDDPRSRHVFNFLSVVKRLHPRAFAMENVKALAVNRRWRQLLTGLRAEAERVGYRTQVLLLNASHYGVPQARERMFLIGLLGGPQVDIHPEPVTPDSPPSVRDALDRLPRFGAPGNDTASTAKVTPAKKPVLRRSPFAGMLFNGQGRPMNLDRPAPTLPASMGGNRTPIVDQVQYELGGDSWVVSYHKHLWAGGEPYDEVPERLRRLTVEEAAELQTFPQGMHWSGSQSAQFRQIGNAVPPVLAYHVALAVRGVVGFN